MERSLNDIMEFDHVIKVNKDLTIDESTTDVNPYFELYCYLVDVETWEWSGDEELISSLPAGWTLLSGFTGQYSYNGPVMHPSEFIGGGLERHIRETPGYYVALVVESDCGYKMDNCDPESGCDCEPAGWAVAYKPLDS